MTAESGWVGSGIVVLAFVAGAMVGERWTVVAIAVAILPLLASLKEAGAVTDPFRRDPGHPQWHHGNFQDHKDNVRRMTHELLHSRAQVRALPFACARSRVGCFADMVYVDRFHGNCWKFRSWLAGLGCTQGGACFN